MDESQEESANDWETGTKNTLQIAISFEKAINGYLHMRNKDRVVMGNISHIILLSSSVNKSIRRAKKARITELTELVDCHSVTVIESATVIWYVSA